MPRREGAVWTWAHLQIGYCVAVSGSVAKLLGPHAVLASGLRRALSAIQAWCAITRRYLRPTKIHHIYFILASVDLAAVAAGLTLNHSLNQTLARSVNINSSLNERFADIDEVRRHVDAVVAIGHNVAFGRIAVDDATDFEAACNTANSAIDAIQTTLLRFAKEHEHLLRPDSGVYQSLAQVLTVEILGKSTIQNAAMAVSYYRRRELAQGASYAIEFSQSHNRLLTELSNLSRILMTAEQDLQADQLAEGRRMRMLEYLLGMMIVVMVCAITVYGHKLGNSFQRKHLELEQAHEATSEAEAKASRLNVELTDSLRELEQAQQEIVRKGKLAQLGQLTATIAHELRNPLSAVKMSVQLIERKLVVPDPGLKKAVDRINNGITRCDQIIGQLLDFAQAKPLDLHSLVLDEWLARVIDEARATIPGSVRISVKKGLDGRVCKFDPERLQRVVLHLLSNATEAMIGKQGTNCSHPVAEPRIEIASRIAAGRIEIVVSDNGPGIREEDLAHIMEPLYTTKSFGVGLGLPAIEKSLQDHGGGLECESRIGSGAKFTAWLPMPRADDARREMEPQGSERAIESHRERTDPRVRALADVS